MKRLKLLTFFLLLPLSLFAQDEEWLIPWITGVGGSGSDAITETSTNFIITKDTITIAGHLVVTTVEFVTYTASTGIIGPADSTFAIYNSNEKFHDYFAQYDTSSFKFYFSSDEPQFVMYNSAGGNLVTINDEGIGMGMPRVATHYDLLRFEDAGSVSVNSISTSPTFYMFGQNMYKSDGGGVTRYNIGAAAGYLYFNGGGFVLATGSGSPTQRIQIPTSGNVGIGSDNSPDYFFDVQGALHADGDVTLDADFTMSAGDAEIYDTGDLASESIADNADFSTGNWTLTDEVAVVSTDAVYTFASSGAGMIIQSSGNMTIAGVGSRWYVFDYTVSGVSGIADEVVTITTAFALTAVTLDVSSNGAQTVTFKSAVSPANFVIDITSVTAGTFTIDEVSLKQVTGGDLAVHGDLTAFGSITDGTFTVDGSGNFSGVGTLATTGAISSTITGTLTMEGHPSNALITSSNGLVIATGGSSRLFFRSGSGNFDINDNNSYNIYLAVGGGSVNIGTQSAGTALQIERADAYITLKNSTAENGEGGAETRIIFEDHANTALAQIEGSHSGTSDDTKGKLILSTHTGSALTAAIIIDDAQGVTIISLDDGGVDVFADADGKLIPDPSDIKFKEDIRDIDGALEMVMKLRGRHYNWKKNAPILGSEYGMVAQEVAEVSNDLVVNGKYMGIKSRGVIALLVEAVKEQQQQIEELKKEAR